MKNIISVKNLGKDFKVRQNKNIFTGIWRPDYRYVSAVKEVSFEVKSGESLALLGPNGAGKTTTIKALTGLIYPTRGEASVLGFTPFDRQPEFLRQIGLLMGNKAGLNWDLTARQSFYLLREIYNLNPQKCDERVNELAELMSVKHVLDVPVRKLSLGERMKLELIGAIIHSPQVLFLDEPTIGLDIVAKKKIRHFLREIQDRYKVTIILTSHDMTDVEKVCDRVIVINKGEKIYDGTVEKLVEEHNEEKLVKFYFETTPNDLPKVPHSELIETSEDCATYRVKTIHMPKLISSVTSHVPVLDIDILATPLEDIIEDLFKK
ncbi:MAG: ATP-binding cassette domain-containing protein [Candidatus Vogelbacteria bacterium]|nr:ATP-binding cassette domain-containing protein [Candidatus Vogelbacteria bacterium]